MRGLLLAMLCALLVVGCGGGTESAPDETPSMPVESPAPETTTEKTSDPPETPADPSRPLAPSIAGETLEGERTALADFMGQPVLVNVWSSW